MPKKKKKAKEKKYKPIDNNVGMLRPNIPLQLPVMMALKEQKKLLKDIFVKPYNKKLKSQKPP